jgi:putative ABC transport system substrate-binding protein
MRRREFIELLGGAAVTWPLVARAQQPAIPVIGYLDSRSPEAVENRLRGFRQGLKEAGSRDLRVARVRPRRRPNELRDSAH